MSKSSPSRLTPSRRTEAWPPPKLNLHFDVYACTFGHYPWDDWERYALARGLNEDRRQWEILMRTDGLRGDYPPSRGFGAASPARSTNWTWGFLRADACRLLAKLQAQPATLHD